MIKMTTTQQEQLKRREHILGHLGLASRVLAIGLVLGAATAEYLATDFNPYRAQPAVVQYQTAAAKVNALRRFQQSIPDIKYAPATLEHDITHAETELKTVQQHLDYQAYQGFSHKATYASLNFFLGAFGLTGVVSGLNVLHMRTRRRLRELKA